jgi:hypothetical protein
MATVESFVLDVLKVLLDWLSIAVILCIIYMLFQLVSGGKLGKLFGGGDDDDDDSSNNRRRSKKNNTDGGENNGPEDTSKDYPDWADGLGTVSDSGSLIEDDKPLQGRQSGGEAPEDSEDGTASMSGNHRAVKEPTALRRFLQGR